MWTQELSPTSRKIYGLLQEIAQPLSAYEILDRLRKEGVRSPPTVYRALEKLQQTGLVHRVESLNAFVVCRHSCEDHPARVSPFAICTLCGDVQELSEPALARAVKKLGTEFLAQVDHKVFEVSGVCHACQSKKVAHV